MKFIRQYSLVLLIVFPLAILVLIRTMTTGHFKYNARKLAEASFNNSNIVSWDRMGSFPGKTLIIDLSDNDQLVKIHPGSIVNIPFKSLLEKKELKLLRSHKGPLMLYSEEPGITAKAWMILSQMGYREVYILAEKKDNEVLKYEFHPDTVQAGNSY